MSWCVKAVYAHGSHFVFDRNGQRLRYGTEQEAKVAAEDLTADNRRFNEGKEKNGVTSYIVVEEHL